ncbi:MAG TPA: hypothetical protein VFZ70_14515 [Euzebyales bacterium]
MRNRHMRHVAVVGLIVLALALLVAPAPASAHSRPYCGIWWGSLAKSAGVGHADWLMEGRVGQHPCFDRLVFELAGPAAGARVRYVDRLPVVPGRTVQPSGGARLMIRIPTGLPPASATDGSVQSTLGPVNSGPLFDVRGFRTFRDVRWARIDANGAVIGLGVRARLPFRVFVLDGPGERSRVVVDVAHRW